MPKNDLSALSTPDGKPTIATLLKVACLKAAFRNPTRVEPAPDSPATSNPAVAHCVRAYNAAIQTTTSRGKEEPEIRETAQNAYRDALPPLFGHDNIRNFIACVAQGILLQVISPTEGARLLYAARIAASAHRSRPHRASLELPSKSPKGSQNPPANQAESAG